MKIEMKGPAGLVPVDEKDVRSYKSRGYVEVETRDSEPPKAKPDFPKVPKPETKAIEPKVEEVLEEAEETGDQED